MVKIIFGGDTISKCIDILLNFSSKCLLLNQKITVIWEAGLLCVFTGDWSVDKMMWSCNHKCHLRYILVRPGHRSQHYHTVRRPSTQGTWTWPWSDKGPPSSPSPPSSSQHHGQRPLWPRTQWVLSQAFPWPPLVPLTQWGERWTRTQTGGLQRQIRGKGHKSVHLQF